MNARAFVLGLPCLTLILGCDLGEIVTLGSSVNPGTGGTASGGTTGSGGGSGLGGLGGAPPLLSVSTVALVTELSSPEKDDNPTLTADERMICFTSLRPGATGDNDIWCAERTSTSEPFGAAAPIDVANQEGFEASPALELDGLALWFGSERDDTLGGSDIFVVRRSSRSEAWGQAARVDELCSSEDDIPRPPAMQGTVMPFASRRDDDAYWTYLAERPDPSAPFGEPRLLEELAVTDTNVVDGFLTEDGLMLLFTRDLRSDEEQEDIYVTMRPDLDSPFGTPTPVLGLNGSAHDRDPWLSTDRRRLYFSSDRSGEFEIYMASVE